MTEKVTEFLVQRDAVRVVPLERINFDRQNYQRDEKPVVKYIMANLDEKALGVPLVAQREDGSLWCVDGQQRIIAVTRLNWKDIRCRVFMSTGPEEEARIFGIVNGKRQGMRPVEIYKGLLTAGDEEAWAIKTAVEKAGFTITTGGKHGTKSSDNEWLKTTCINTLFRVYRTGGEYGADSITFAFNTTKECWPGDKLATNADLIGGLCSFYIRRKGVVDTVGRLYPRLKTTTAYKVLYTAQTGTIGNNKINAVANEIERQYSKRSVGRPKGQS